MMKLQVGIFIFAIVTLAAATTPALRQKKNDLRRIESPLQLGNCKQSSSFKRSLCDNAIQKTIKSNKKLYVEDRCSHIAKETGWWSAKTRKPALITKVRIVNRLDCCQERLNDFVISVDGVVCARHKSNVTFSEKFFDCNKIGREIMISSNKEYLTLCKVQVFGEFVVTYHWAQWSSWSSCTKTCGPHGTRSRNRNCQASNNSTARASQCHGTDSDVQRCNTAEQCPDSARSDSRFAKRQVRMCLKPEFIETVQAKVNSSGDCANHCNAQGSKCQGFRFQSQVSDAMCQLFAFNKCSHDANVASCTKQEMVYVRNQLGLPPGQLCPSSYGHRHGSSVYSIINATSWHQGFDLCSSHLGLTKFADASDTAEAAHMHRVKSSLGLPFFVGGIMVSPADYRNCTEPCKSTWEWVGCKTPIADNVWDKGQPNHISRGHVFTDIWTEHTLGVDSTPDTWRETLSIDHAMCECVDPFHGASMAM